MKRLDDNKKYIISIPKESLRAHDAYYAKNIASKFKEQEYNKILSRKIKSALKKKRGMVDNSELDAFFHSKSYEKFKGFMAECDKVKDVLAIGRFGELLKLKNSLKQKMDSVFVGGGFDKEINSCIVNIFGYNKFLYTPYDLRDKALGNTSLDGKTWCAYSFLMMLKIRVCPYCNEQYIPMVLNKKHKLRPEIDHFLPKAEYPFFSMSIYNLVPSCNICNCSLKQENEFSDSVATPYDINYYEDYDFYPEVAYNEVRSIDIVEAKNQIHELLEMFAIKERYQIHLNVVKEFLKKYEMYNGDFFMRMRKEISNVGISEKELLFMIFGVPLSRDDIPKDVLNKLKYDIGRLYLKGYA